MFDSNIIDYIFRYGVYLILIIAALLVAYPLIKPLFKRRTNYGRLRKSKFIKTRLFKHINKILIITLNIDSELSVYLFVLMVSLLFSFSLRFFNYIGQTSNLKVMVSFLIASIPYVVLRIRLYSIQVESSYEGEELISELSNQYKINYFNMQSAITKTIPNLKNSPYCSRALIRLARQLPKYRTNDELMDLIEEFIFSIGTEWATLLGNCMINSLISEERVEGGLDDIINDLKDLNKISEANKRNNHETFIIIKYIIPGTYILGLFVLFKVMGFTKTSYIELQFKNQLGFKCFALTMILMIVNYFVYLIIKKPKNDF